MRREDTLKRPRSGKFLNDFQPFYYLKLLKDLRTSRDAKTHRYNNFLNAHLGIILQVFELTKS